MNTTTRRHPRSLTEAFNDAHRAEWIERPHATSKIAEVLFAVALGVIGAVALVYGWSV